MSMRLGSLATDNPLGARTQRFARPTRRVDYANRLSRLATWIAWYNTLPGRKKILTILCRYWLGLKPFCASTGETMNAMLGEAGAIRRLFALKYPARTLTDQSGFTLHKRTRVEPSCRFGKNFWIAFYARYTITLQSSSRIECAKLARV